jgi:hypothetical protein
MDSATIEQVVKIAKLKQADKLRLAIGHNMRTDGRDPAHVDRSRTHLNRILRGGNSFENIKSHSDSLMATITKTLRWDFIRWNEVVISLPANSGINEAQFFIDSVEWCELCFEVPILSAIVHNDEDNPHVHVILLPLFNGGMKGSTFCKMNRYWPMQNSFNDQVGKRYGLSVPKPKTVHSRVAREQAAVECIIRMKATIQNQSPEFWDAIRQTAITNPAALMKHYGVEYQRSTRTKGKCIGFDDKAKCIGFDNLQSIPEKEQSLSCVDFGVPSNDISPDNTEPVSEYTRERDSDILATHWNFDTGEPIKAPVKVKQLDPKIEQAKAQIINLAARRSA